MRIITWNVNGLRSILKKDFEKQIKTLDPDVICLQETKTHQQLLLPVLSGYEEFWCFGERAGYSGTLTLVKEKLISQIKRVSPPELISQEGRTVALEFPQFFLLNTYFPNGGMGPARLKYKLEYYQKYLTYIKELEQIKPVIFCGDINTAHQEIDLARPKANEKNTGFLPEERAWLDQVIKAGFVDVWRKIHGPEKIEYSWWDYKTRARERNVGWRIDYFFSSNSLLNIIESSKIASHFLGSDHVPVVLDLQIGNQSHN